MLKYGHFVSHADKSPSLLLVLRFHNVSCFFLLRLKPLHILLKLANRRSKYQCFNPQFQQSDSPRSGSLALAAVARVLMLELSLGSPLMGSIAVRR